MRVQNLNLAKEAQAEPPEPMARAVVPKPAEVVSSRSEILPDDSRQTLEIALLRARIQHLELVSETARGLLGSNQDRLLRRLYEIPRELATLSTQLQRIDPQATW